MSFFAPIPEPPMTTLQRRIGKWTIRITLFVAFTVAVTCFVMWGAK